MYIYVYIYMYSMYIGIQLRLSSVCFLFTIFELLSSIGKERRTFYSQVEELPLIVPGIQEENRIDLDCIYCFNSSLTKTFINTVVLSWILYCLNLSLSSITKLCIFSYFYLFTSFIYFILFFFFLFFCTLGYTPIWSSENLNDSRDKRWTTSGNLFMAHLLRAIWREDHEIDSAVEARCVRQNSVDSSCTVLVDVLIP